MGQFLWAVEYGPVMELPQITANLSHAIYVMFVHEITSISSITYTVVLSS